MSHIHLTNYKVTAGSYPTSASSQVSANSLYACPPDASLWRPTALSHSGDTLDELVRRLTSLTRGAIRYRMSPDMRLTIDLLRLPC
jgi:hypothetical protein